MVTHVENLANQRPTMPDSSVPNPTGFAAYNLGIGAYQGIKALDNSTNSALDNLDYYGTLSQNSLHASMQNGQDQLTAGQGMLSNVYAKGMAANSSALDAYFNSLGIPNASNPNANSSSVLQSLRNTPGYQFTQQQGLDQINANAASKGSLISGNTLKAALDYSTGLADSTYQSYVKNMADAVGLTKSYVDNYANLSAGLYGQSANLYGQEGVASSNLYQNTGKNIADTYTNYGQNIASIYSNYTGGMAALSGSASGGGGGGSGMSLGGFNVGGTFGKMLGQDNNPTIYNPTYYSNQGGNGLGGVSGFGSSGGMA